MELLEAIWFSFMPLVEEPDRWRLDKMGVPISPLEAVPDGNCRRHAVQAGVSYSGADGFIEIASHDAALVAPGKPSLLEFDDTLPDLRGGMHFNLCNNVW